MWKKHIGPYFFSIFYNLGKNIEDNLYARIHITEKIMFKTVNLESVYSVSTGSPKSLNEKV